jgi:hypothetical protein
LEWKDQKQFICDLAEEGVVTKAFLNRPELRFDLQLVWHAWWELCEERAIISPALGPITFLSVDRYAARYGVGGGDQFVRFHHLIRAMDLAYRAWKPPEDPKDTEKDEAA